MSAVGSSCWGSSEGQILVHVLQKLALPTRWVNRHWLLVSLSSSTTRAPGRASQCGPHLWSIHVGGRGVGLWWGLPWAQASPTDWYRTIVASCGGKTPLLTPAEMRRHPFEVGQPSLGGKALVILGSWQSRDDLLKTMRYWMTTSPKCVSLLEALWIKLNIAFCKLTALAALWWLPQGSFSFSLKNAKIWVTVKPKVNISFDSEQLVQALMLAYFPRDRCAPKLNNLECIKEL